MATMATDAPGDDLLAEEAPVIIDCDVIEAAKENIQPIASGRRVTTLSAILSTPHAQREARLSATKNRLRINVQIALEDDDDDPLEAYCRLVYWTVENYPQGHSAESGLLELLEEATRVLKDDRDGMWRDDIRYLKLWVLYASYVERPAVIYKYLVANEIGTAFELLYEQYAVALECSGRRNEADKVYLLGIARQASPLERLKKKHDEFQKRMMVSSMDPEPATTVAPSSTRRTILATTSSTASTRTGGLSVRPVASSLNDDVFSSNAASIRPVPNARMQIFVDPTGAESESSTTNAYPDLGTRHSRIKENIPDVKKASGTTLRQAGRSQRNAATPPSGPGGSRIEVYRDPEPGTIEENDAGDMPPPPVPESKKTGKQTVPRTPVRTAPPDSEGSGIVSPTPSFTPYRDETANPTQLVTPAPEPVMKVKRTEAEALRRDPFKNYDKDKRPELEGDD